MQQQIALLALSEERLQVIETERRLASVEAERVICDHELSLLRSGELDTALDKSRSNARIAELEVSRVRIAHR